MMMSVSLIYRESRAVKKSGIKTGVCVIGLLLVLLRPVPSFAGVTMFVSPDGDGAYILEADNVQGVTALDMMIGYDSGSLSNPQVEAQGGAVTDVYAGTPGIVNVSVERENPDVSFELHLKFEKKGDTTKGLTYVTAITRDSNGRNSAASADTRALSPPTRDAGYGTDVVAVSTAASGLEQSGADGKMFDFDDQEKCVLQRFKEFRGRRELKAFTALFKRSGRDRTTQEPAIALSDGKTPVAIRLTPQLEGNDSPDIALSNAALGSIHKDGGKNWIVTVVPNEGVWEAELIFKVGREVIDFPLVVSPRVKLADGINEENFLDALNRFCPDLAVVRKGENVPHLNDYIFIANYLAILGNSSERKISR